MWSAEDRKEYTKFTSASRFGWLFCFQESWKGFSEVSLEKEKEIKMIHVGDNTWNLRVMITDLQVEKTLRVKGDLHIGGVMLKLSKTEGELAFASYQLEHNSLEFPSFTIA